MHLKHSLEDVLFNSATSTILAKDLQESHNIKFVDTDSLEKPVYLTSWGSSTRLIGALVMAHGDQQGIVFPPQVALSQLPSSWPGVIEPINLPWNSLLKSTPRARHAGATIARRDVGTRLGPRAL